MKSVSVSVSIVCALASVAATSGCGDNFQAVQPTSDAPSSSPVAVAVAPSADYMAPGILSKLDVAQLTTQTNLAAGLVAGDPVLRRIGDTLYVINRNINSVTMLDGHSLGYLDQMATGANSNPQDVAVVGDQLFIPALGTTGVVVGTRGSNTPTTIDLSDALHCKSTCGPGDGAECRAPCAPSCTSAYAIGNDVYVACGLLNNFKPTGNGKIAVIDSASQTVRTVIELPVPNPYNQFIRTPLTSVFGGDLLIPTLDYNEITFETNGTVVRVGSGAAPTASVAIPSTDLQGAVSHIEVLEGPSPLLVMAVTLKFGEGRLRAFDLETKLLWKGALSPAAQDITDLAACPDGSMVVADRSGNGGLRVYSDGAEVTSAALSIGLKPGTGNQLACYRP